ncbi:MAG: FAD/NAD(P)-binding protein [Edaphobacter sp.]|uniref:FAD/NAD(P)-binding protein n=1 Tax=Edaphobacter sp. TaxID=1934404 RepID=UPI00239C552D|nr:FAD/NAD(P)-binding protein [Edaphobacter sp.]MDE1175903.1 FAD/NAD(P)-binding protein [Edaphobacter sp.]
MLTNAKTIAIIGAGASGTLTAYHLISQAERNRLPLRVLLIDPRPQLGLGLAYSTPSLRHLLNVPTAKISAIPSDPDHFLRWVRAHYDPTVQPFSFMPRAIFGRYLRSLHAEVASRIEHIPATATSLVRRADNTLLITLSDEAARSGNTTVTVDHVVLATGNFDPQPLPNISPAALERGLYRNNAWAHDTFDDLDPAAPIALIGTGLTAVDVVLRLRELGHHGPITCVSRHGVFSQRHIETAPTPAPVIPRDTPPTALAYLRALRNAIGAGIPWRAAVDSLRSITNQLWLALPLDEQSRFLRHLNRRWLVVRHRMAPAIADVIEAELAAGTLRVIEGSFAGLTPDTGNNARINVRTAEGLAAVTATRVINCTGPSASYRRVDSPILHSLFAQGLATPGPLGAAINTSNDGALIDTEGHAATNLFTLGPARLGNLFESIAMPEIREQANDLARLLLARIASNTAATSFPAAFIDTAAEAASATLSR